MPKISQIDEVPCQAEVRILQTITLKYQLKNAKRYKLQPEAKLLKTFQGTFVIGPSQFDKKETYTQPALITNVNFHVFLNLTFRMLFNIHFQK